MITVLATDIANKIELVTNGQHAYWTRPTSGVNRFRYAEFAGRKLDDAIKSLHARATLGY